MLDLGWKNNVRNKKINKDFHPNHFEQSKQAITNAL